MLFTPKDCSPNLVILDFVVCLPSGVAKGHGLYLLQEPGSREVGANPTKEDQKWKESICVQEEELMVIFQTRKKTNTNLLTYVCISTFFTIFLREKKSNLILLPPVDIPLVRRGEKPAKFPP